MTNLKALATVITLMGTSAFVAPPPHAGGFGQRSHVGHQRFRGIESHNNSPTMRSSLFDKKKVEEPTIRVSDQEQGLQQFINKDSLQRFIEKAARDLLIVFLENKIEEFEAHEKVTFYMKLFASEVVNGTHLVPMLHELASSAATNEMQEVARWLLDWLNGSGHSFCLENLFQC